MCAKGPVKLWPGQGFEIDPDNSVFVEVCKQGLHGLGVSDSERWGPFTFLENPRFWGLNPNTQNFSKLSPGGHGRSRPKAQDCHLRSASLPLRPRHKQGARRQGGLHCRNKWLNPKCMFLFMAPNRVSQPGFMYMDAF